VEVEVEELGNGTRLSRFSEQTCFSFTNLF